MRPVGNLIKHPRSCVPRRPDKPKTGAVAQVTAALTAMTGWPSSLVPPTPAYSTRSLDQQTHTKANSTEQHGALHRHTRQAVHLGERERLEGTGGAG